MMLACGLHTVPAPLHVGHSCMRTCEQAGRADLVGSRPDGRPRREAGSRSRSPSARNGQAQRLMGVRRRREGALAAEVEFTPIQCGVYSRVHLRVLVRVRDGQLVSAAAGLCVFPGCAVAKPHRGVPSQGQCIPPIAQARFGAPRRCDALRFLLPLQAVRQTAISQKAQRGRATLVASRSTGCSHTRCHRSTMPRFHGTACSEPRFIPEQT